MPPITSEDAKLDVLVEAILFLVRHGSPANLADAFVADLHRAFAGDAARRAIVDGLAAQLRDPNLLVAENDA